MVRRLNLPALGTALAASLILAACGGDSDAPDPLAPQDEPPVEEAPEPDGGADADEVDARDSAAAGAHLDASSISFDGEDLEIADITCYIPDNPNWWLIDVDIYPEEEAPLFLHVAGNPELDNPAEESFIELRVTPRDNSEHGNDRDEFLSTGATFDAATDYEFSMEGASGTVELIRQTRPVQGEVMPDGLDREITFTLVCP